MDATTPTGDAGEDSVFTWNDVETWSNRLGNLYNQGRSIYDSAQEPDQAKPKTPAPAPQPAQDKSWIKWVIIGVAGLIGLVVVMRLIGGRK